METKETFYQNGQLNEKYEFFIDEAGKNIKDGKYEKWYENGIKECEGEYMENKKFGYWKYWNKDGVLREEGEYIDDVKSDNWNIYQTIEKDTHDEKKESPEQSIEYKSDPDAEATTKYNLQAEKPQVNNVIEQEENIIPEQVILKDYNDTDIKSSHVYSSQNKSPNKNILIIFSIGVILVLVIIIVFISSSSDDEKINNTEKTNSQVTSKQQSESKYIETPKTETGKNVPNLNTPEGVVTKFIQSLGKQDWSAAFGLMTEKRRGSYTKFASTKGYGGITSTTIFSCEYNGEIGGKKEVIADYESIDPSNKSGRFKQYFYLTPFYDSYLIVDITNISIIWY